MPSRRIRVHPRTNPAGVTNQRLVGFRVQGDQHGHADEHTRGYRDPAEQRNLRFAC